MKNLKDILKPKFEVHYVSILEENYLLASLKERFWAEVINRLLLSILFYPLLKDTDYLDMRDLYILPLLSCVSALLYPFVSGNLGHWMLGIKVVHEDSAYNYHQFHLAFCREFLKNILFYLLFPLAWLIFDPKGQNPYDKWCGTLVVRK